MRDHSATERNDDNPRYLLRTMKTHLELGVVVSLTILATAGGLEATGGGGRARTAGGGGSKSSSGNSPVARSDGGLDTPPPTRGAGW